ncbi:MAG TPA: hypothetical protein DFS52_12025 [Myxococcales bacterium]|nr:hypothetical protein [Myxococcales bacterium]
MRERTESVRGVQLFVERADRLLEQQKRAKWTCLERRSLASAAANDGPRQRWRGARMGDYAFVTEASQADEVSQGALASTRWSKRED